MMRKKDCLLLLAVLQLTTPSSAQNTSTTIPSVTTSVTTTTTIPSVTTSVTTTTIIPSITTSSTSAPLSYLTRPADVTVAVGKPAVFVCGVPEASPNIKFILYGTNVNLSLTCPNGHVEDIMRALYGSCYMKKGQSLAVWTFKGTTFSDNNTRVVCQWPNNPDAPVAFLHVYSSSVSYITLIGCAIGGFFGIILVFGLSYTMLRRSETLQKCFRGKETEDDLDMIITKDGKGI